MKFYIYIPLILLISLPVFGQKGKIQGRVFNEKNNESLPFSNILINDTEIGTTSNFEGEFIITGVEPGFVTLTVRSLGFETIVTEEIQITNNKTANIDIGLKETSLSLNEVQITASKFKKTEESPISLRTLSASEIENSPGANRDISKVIQNLPGVAALAAPGRNDIIVRGGASNESRFFLDDVEIPYINHFSTQGASGGSNGILNADFIREVEFYSGAFPANRGNALSGVFNFKQIDGNKDKMKFRGSLGASETSLTVDGPIGDNTTYIASIRRSYLQFLFKAIGLPFLPTFNDYQIKVKTRLDDKNEIKIISIGALDDFALDTDIKNPTEDQKYILNQLPVYGQWSYTIGGVYKHYRKKGYNTFVLSRNMLNNRIYKYINNNESLENNKVLDYISEEVENKFRFESNLKTNSDWKLTYGISAELAKYYNSTFLKIFNESGEDTLDYSSDLSLYKWGAFGQISKRIFNDKVSLSFGLRAGANDYSNEMNNLFEQLSPRFSASYQLSKKYSLNFNAGRYYQLPNYTTLGYRNNNNILVNKENGIKYISADHIVGGLEFMPDENKKITLEGFYKYYKDYPFSISDSISLAHRMINFGTLGDEALSPNSEGHAFGLEFLIQAKFDNKLNLVASYTYAISEFKDKTGKFIPTGWDNRHIFIITASKKFKRGWYMGIKWRYAGGLPYTPYDLDRSELITAWNFNSGPYMDYNLLNSNRLEPFHQLDFRVDKIFYFNKASLKLYLDIQNLYSFKSDEQDRITNLDENGNLMVDPGDNTKYILRNIASDGSGTVLPSIGIIVDF